MEDQRCEPRVRVEEMFWGVVERVGVVEREEEISEGREALKAPRQFIVRGTYKQQESEWARSNVREEVVKKADGRTYTIESNTF